MSEDPRVSRSKSAAITATLELIGERGVGDTSVDEVAARSGIAKTTIYRHWDSKAALLLDAVGSRLEPPQEPDTGALATDLQALLDGVATALSHGPLGELLPSLVAAAAHDEEFARLHARFASSRHDVVRGVLQRGIERGELRRDVDLDEVIALLAGPLFYRHLVAGEPLGPRFTRAIVETVLVGLVGRQGR